MRAAVASVSRARTCIRRACIDRAFRPAGRNRQVKKKSSDILLFFFSDKQNQIIAKIKNNKFSFFFEKEFSSKSAH